MLWASDAPARSAGRVVRVLPDEPAIDKTFDYLVPESLGDQVRVGTRVRIALGGRRVGGWIVAVDVSPPPGVTPRPLAKLSGYGPPADLIDLARWAAWRWAGRPASFLRTANPDRIVTSLPRPAPSPPALPGPPTPLVADAFALPPAPPPIAPPATAPDPAPPTAGEGPRPSGPPGSADRQDARSSSIVSGAGGWGAGDAAAGTESRTLGRADQVGPGSVSVVSSAGGPGAGPAAGEGSRPSGGLGSADRADAGSSPIRPVAGGPGAGDAAAGTGSGSSSGSAGGDRVGPGSASVVSGAGGLGAGDVAAGEGPRTSGGLGSADRAGAGSASSARADVARTPVAEEAGTDPSLGAAGGGAGSGRSAAIAEGAASMEGGVGGGVERAVIGRERGVGDPVRSVVRLAPAEDPYPVVRAAAALGNALVICPTVALARSMGMRLRRDGVGVAFHPRDWAAGAAGATVIGTRAAAWAPVADLAAVVVLDEHDESHAQEQAPTWHARDVVAERARRAGVPCVLVSPCPSLEALSWGRLLAPSRHDERAGWPVVDVVDRRQDDPRTGLLSPRLVDLLRSDRRVVCVLNRTGRAKLLACAACGELARCEACDAALAQVADEGTLACPRCHTVRPVVCAACGGTRLKLLRQGVSRVREELEALVGEPVDEVSSLKADARRPGGRVVVGTEAVLHQVDRADAVAFLDLDQELLAPRYRTVEQALGLLARAARLVGGKAGGGRLLLQTRVPRHEVVQAVLHGDPARVAEAEAERRALLRFPPAWAMAEVSGPAAPAYIASLRAVLAGTAPLASSSPTSAGAPASRAAGLAETPPADPSAAGRFDPWSSVPPRRPAAPTGPPPTRPPDLWSSAADGQAPTPPDPERPPQLTPADISSSGGSEDAGPAGPSVQPTAWSVTGSPDLWPAAPLDQPAPPAERLPGQWSGAADDGEAPDPAEPGRISRVAPGDISSSGGSEDGGPAGPSVQATAWSVTGAPAERRPDLWSSAVDGQAPTPPDPERTSPVQAGESREPSFGASGSPSAAAGPADGRPTSSSGPEGTSPASQEVPARPFARGPQDPPVGPWGAMAGDPGGRAAGGGSSGAAGEAADPDRSEGTPAGAAVGEGVGGVGNENGWSVGPWGAAAGDPGGRAAGVGSSGAAGGTAGPGRVERTSAGGAAFGGGGRGAVDARGVPDQPEVEILGPADGRWLVRAPDHRVLCDTLARVPRPPGRLRLAVDPLRV